MPIKAIDSPSHYNYGSKEVIDFLDETLDDAEFIGYCLGNAIKYLARRNHKNNRFVDVGKAKWYIQRIMKCTNIDPDEDLDPSLFMQEAVVEAMSTEGKYELLCSIAYQCVIEGNFQGAYAFIDIADNMIDYHSMNFKNTDFTTYLNEYCASHKGEY